MVLQYHCCCVSHTHELALRIERSNMDDSLDIIEVQHVMSNA